MRDMEFRHVYDIFAQTEYGERLEGTIRYEKYNLGGLPKDEWCELLGKDANNLHHMEATYELAEQFIESQNKSDKEPIDLDTKSLLLLSAIIHDQAEGVVGIGDVSYGDKTSTDEIREVVAFESHLDAMNPGMDAVTKSMANSAIRGIIFDPSTKEGGLFNAIERTGYLMTALRAAERLPSITDQKTTDGLNWLITDVLLNQMSTLVDYTRAYHLPYKILAQNAEMISNLFATVPEATFGHYSDNSQQKKEDFIKAQQVWAAFCSQHSL